VVASPKCGPWWVLWIRVCPWFICAPKCSNYALTNLLFGLCRSVWVIEVFVNLLSSISKLQHLPLVMKCCELKSALQLLLPLFTFGLTVEFIKDLEVHQNKCQRTPTKYNTGVWTNTNKTQQRSVDEHHQSIIKECQQALIKYNNGAPMNTNKMQQKNANEY